MASYQLDYCKKCIHKHFDFKSGILCKLTNESPDFIGQCPSYVLNENIVERKYIAPDKVTIAQVSGGTRFLNYLIDRIVIFLLSAVVGVMIGLSGRSEISKLESYAIAIFLILVYYILLESISGQTLGKLITGTIVITKDGHRPDFGTIVGRTFSRLIPFEAFSFLGEDGSGWHDSISNTKVVKKSEVNFERTETGILDSNL